MAGPGQCCVRKVSPSLKQAFELNKTGRVFPAEGTASKHSCGDELGVAVFLLLPFDGGR